MFKFIKKIKEKINPNLPEEKYGCNARFLYQDENVTNVYRIISGMTISEMEEVDFNAKARAISSYIRDIQLIDVTELSTVIIEVETDESCYKDVIETLANADMTTIQKIEDGNIKILLSGSIKNYKDLIKYTKNQSNYIVQGIIEELYNCNACYFADFIEDEIMETRFSNSDNSWRSIYKEGNGRSGLLSFDNRNFIYNLVSHYGFSYYDAIKCCYVILYNGASSTIERHRSLDVSKKYHDSQIDLIFDENVLKNVIVTEKLYDEVFKPEYIKFEESQEYYKEIDEVIEEQVTEVRDIKQEEEMPMVVETDDGDLDYDPKYFE